MRNFLNNFSLYSGHMAYQIQEHSYTILPDGSTMFGTGKQNKTQWQSKG
jgi:hypothetical protein